MLCRIELKSEQMSLESFAEDREWFRCPDNCREFIPPLRYQNRDESCLHWEQPKPSQRYQPASWVRCLCWGESCWGVLGWLTPGKSLLRYGRFHLHSSAGMVLLHHPETPHQTEAQFALREVTADATKCYYVVSALGSSTAMASNKFFQKSSSRLDCLNSCECHSALRTQRKPSSASWTECCGTCPSFSSTWTITSSPTRPSFPRWRRVSGSLSQQLLLTFELFPLFIFLLHFLTILFLLLFWPLSWAVWRPDLHSSFWSQSFFFSTFSAVSGEPLRSPIVYSRDQLLALSSAVVLMSPASWGGRDAGAAPELFVVAGGHATDPSSRLSSWGM